MKLTTTVPAHWLAGVGLLGALAGTALPAMADMVYGSTRGWTIVAQDQGGYQGCIMERPGNGLDLVAARRNGRWELSFPARQPDGTQITVDMEVDRASQIWNGTVQNGWVTVEASQDWMTAIGKASDMQASVGAQRGEISTIGTMAAILKLEECDRNRGHLTRSAAPRPGNSAPAQAVESETLRMGAGCPALGEYRSPNLQDWGDITFVNRAHLAVTIYWLDDNGQPVEIIGLLPGEQARLDSTAGHYFIAKDVQMTCHGGVIEVPLGETVHEIR